MNRNELIVNVLADLNKGFPDDEWSRADVKNCIAAARSLRYLSRWCSNPASRICSSASVGRRAVTSRKASASRSLGVFSVRITRWASTVRGRRSG